MTPKAFKVKCNLFYFMSSSHARVCGWVGGTARPGGGSCLWLCMSLSPSVTCQVIPELQWRHIKMAVSLALTLTSVAKLAFICTVIMEDATMPNNPQPETLSIKLTQSVQHKQLLRHTWGIGECGVCCLAIMSRVSVTPHVLRSASGSWGRAREAVQEEEDWH